MWHRRRVGRVYRSNELWIRGHTIVLIQQVRKVAECDREKWRLGKRTRTYPVEYTYDAQGRMRTMKTWQDFGNCSGAFGWPRQKWAAVEGAAKVFEDGQAVFA